MLGAGGGGFDELLEGLRAVEDAGGGLGDDVDGVAGGGILLREEDVAFVVHGGVEGEVVGGEELSGFGGVGAQEVDGEVGGACGGRGEAALGQGLG